MNPLPRTLLIAALVVLAFDVVGAFASKALGFSYASLSFGSFLIYAGAGFFASRLGGFGLGALGGASTAFVESTLGWAASWAIGPGRPPDGYTGPLPIIVAVITVVATGAVLGLVGAGIGKLVRRRSSIDA